MSKEEPKKRGRPAKYDPEKVAIELNDYVEENDDPMIQQFCYETKISKDAIYRLAKECDSLNDSIKRCHAKQEVRTIKGAENGTINATFAIFKLKQKCYGWSDKQEFEHSGGVSIKVDWE